MSPRPDGSPFSPDHPRLVCCNDFKGGSKARCSSSTDSSSVAISSAKNVTEYHAAALVSTRRVAIARKRVADRLRHSRALPTGPLGGRPTDTMVEASLPGPFAPWADRGGEGRSGSQG